MQLAMNAPIFTRIHSTWPVLERVMLPSSTLVFTGSHVNRVHEPGQPVENSNVKKGPRLVITGRRVS